MVESRVDSFERADTPTSGGYFTQLPNDNCLEDLSDSHHDAAETYDSSNLPTPTIHRDTSDIDNLSGENISAAKSMDGDARKGMSDSSKAEHTKPGTRRRHSRSTAPNTPQRSNTNSVQVASGPGHPFPSTSTPENALSFQPSSVLHISPTGSQYNPRAGFVGQYTMSAPPTHMNIPHSPPTYAFPPPFHHSMVLDNSMLQQNANYQHMLQPHLPVFSYQHRSVDGTSSHPSYPNMPNPSAYPPQQMHSSSAPTSPNVSSPGQSSSLSPPYSSSAFHAMQYSSPMTASTYRYPAQAYPPSPMYQPQYSPQFAQQYSRAPEHELTWYYYPHLTNPSPQSYDPGQPYQGHYTAYSPVGSAGVDGAYRPTTHSPNPNPNQMGPSSAYAMSSPSFAQLHVDGQTDSPSPAGAGPPSYDGRATGDAQTGALSTSSGSGRQLASDRPLRRRSFHPNPPAHRSEWVMWAGNVPSDATHDELWRFFIAAENGEDEASTTGNGVLSIFLISRSNCAFINYQSSEDLQTAISRFNGVPLRPNDSRCPRMVCRVRRQDDDLKAGVGYQRGMGMHTRWIREQKGKMREGGRRVSETATPDGVPSSPGSVSGSLTRAMSSVSLSSDDDANRSMHVPTHSSSSDSYTSTNSSFLSRYFPERYFILKSLSQEDLDISVERGVWATQKHNEEILDQAFRTSKDVFLIFGVNKSREFYGYARMAGPVIRGEHNIQWTSRPHHSTPASRSSHPPVTGDHPGTFFSPSDHRLVDGSPMPIDGMSSSSYQRGAPGPSNLRHSSAPALLGQEYHKPTLTTPTLKQQSLDQQRRRHDHVGADSFELDPSAPVRAMRAKTSGPNMQDGAGSPLRMVEEEEAEAFEEEAYDPLKPVIQPNEGVQRGEVSWGDSFAVEWRCTERLSFNHTRHLRNPWNRDKEIKVSRDGTELEPSVGRQLLEDWHKAIESQPALAGGAAGKTSGSGKRSASSKPGSPFP